MVAFIFKTLHVNWAILQPNSWTYTVVRPLLVTRGNLLYWSVCSDNDDVPCVFSLPACYWCCLLPYLPATTKSAPDSQQSPLWLVYVRKAITSNVVVRCDHHHPLREDQCTVQLSFSAPSLLEASRNKLKARSGCSNKMRCVRGVTGDAQQWHMTSVYIIHMHAQASSVFLH